MADYVCIRKTDQGFAVYEEPMSDEPLPENAQTAASPEEALALAQQLLTAPAADMAPAQGPGADQAAFAAGFADVRPPAVA